MQRLLVIRILLLSMMAGLCIAFVLSSQSTQAVDVTWNQFRGATGDGLATDESLPIEWSATSGVDRVIELPGRANSAPALTESRIDITTVDEDFGLWVLSFDRETGEKRWERQVGQGDLDAKGPRNLWEHRHNAGTPTPASEEDRIWAYFGTGLLLCLDAESGETLWQKDMQQDYGAYDITFGMGSSPRLYQNALIINCLTKGPSYVVAFDKQTGDELWKTDRNLGTPDDHPDAYSSPIVWERAGEDPSLLVSGSSHVSAYHIESGKQQWICDGLSIDSPYGRVIASAVPAGDLVIATSPNPGGGGLGRIVCVDGTGSGNVSDTHRRWDYARSSPDSSTPVVVGDLVFGLADNSVMSCLHLDSGEEVWRKRLGAEPCHASLIAGDGKVYALAADGTCFVVSADEQGELLATNKLEGTFYATPAVAAGKLYLRAYEGLYVISGQ